VLTLFAIETFAQQQDTVCKGNPQAPKCLTSQPTAQPPNWATPRPTYTPDQQKRRQATLSQQKTCDQQARKSFHESNPTPERFLTFDYTSHFDAAMNVCYVEKAFVGYIGRSESLTVSWAVWDAFEGRGYASYIEVGHDVMDCEITRPGHPIEWCKTGDEFEDLVQKYFGIGR
jgi:hypothetical protein